jgi:hypothetical protein
MTSLSVDAGRLGQEAGTLGSQVSPLGGAASEVTTGTASAMNALGSVNDDGLHSALQQLSGAWSYEITAISSDLSSLSEVMNGLAQAYAQLDSQGASAISRE